MGAGVCALALQRQGDLFAKFTHPADLAGGHTPLDLLRNRQLIAAIDLRPTGQAGTKVCTPSSVRRAIKSCWLNNAGRGPTKLMSPARMLHSCGNWSTLDLRKKEPTGVKCAWASASRYVATAGVPTRMLRNCGSLKITLLQTAQKKIKDSLH